MFDNMPGFTDQVFTCITLVVCAGISAHICHGYGTRKARETFVGLVLLLAVCIQVCLIWFYYYLVYYYVILRCIT